MKMIFNDNKLNLIQYLLLGFVFLSAFQISGWDGATINLDPSFFWVHELALLKNWQFGVDIFSSHGPLGTFFNQYSQGHFLYVRYVFSILMAFSLMLSALFFFKRIPQPLNWLLLILLIAIQINAIVPFLILLASALSIQEIIVKQSFFKNPKLILFILAGSILSMGKFTFLTYYVVSILVISGYGIYKLKFSNTLILLISAALGLATIWLILGQSIDNLIPHLIWSSEISDGYSSSMAIPPSKLALFWAFVGFAFIFTYIFFINIKKKSIENLIKNLLIVLLILLMWKQGFTRFSEMNSIGFFSLMPIGFCLIHMGASLPSSTNRLKFDGMILSFIVMSAIAIQWLPSYAIGFSTLSGNTKFYFHPLLHHQEDLPMIKEEVGKNRVDVFGFRQQSIFLNNLNYKPRPAFQSFYGYTKRLQEQNKLFYKSDERPNYILFDSTAIDHRYPTLEDAMLWAEILTNYEPLFIEKGFYLFKAKDNRRDVSLTPLSRSSYNFNQEISLSDWDDKILFAKVKIKRSLAGKIIKTFYQGERLSILVKYYDGNNNQSFWRFFIPEMAEGGFLINPVIFSFISENLEFENNPNRIQSIQFMPVFKAGHFEEKLEVELFEFNN